MDDAKALLSGLVGAFFQTSRGTDHPQVEIALTHFFDVRLDRPARQPGRAHDQTDILLGAVEVGLFESVIGVTLLRTDEAAGHLHAVRPFGQGMQQIGAVPDASGGDHRHLGLPFPPEVFLDSAHRGVLVVLAGADIFQLLAQMTTGGVGVLDHHRVGEPSPAPVPLAGDQFGRLD